MRCIRCHRPMKHATTSGMGPVCGKSAKPLPKVERDLFGYDVTAAAEAARETVRVHIEALAVDAQLEIRHAFAAARRAHGVWA